MNPTTLNLFGHKKLVPTRSYWSWWIVLPQLIQRLKFFGILMVVIEFMTTIGLISFCSLGKARKLIMLLLVVSLHVVFLVLFLGEG